MTREEAISLLTQVKKILINNNSWLENTHEPLNIAFDMAIKALEQEPCDNVINRNDMLDAIGHGTTYTSEELQKIIKGLPDAAEPIIKHNYVEVEANTNGISN